MQSVTSKHHSIHTERQFSLFSNTILPIADQHPTSSRKSPI
jgi:hypothetical protein